MKIIFAYSLKNKLKTSTVSPCFPGGPLCPCNPGGPLLPGGPLSPGSP